MMKQKDNAQILTVTAAVYVNDNTLRITFSNGEERLLDFTPLMQEGICRKLQDKNYFKSFTLDPFTIDWNNEVGFAPEFLYAQSVRL
jgi:Protein of unknown function (DUF2442).